eukprot:gene14553-16707_t
MNSFGVDEDLKLLHNAASRHANSVIDDVEAKLLINSNMQAKQIGILSKLWREKLQELTLPDRSAIKSNESLYSESSHIHVLSPARLTEHVRTLQPIHGCIGRPAPFLNPPEYASQLRKPGRKGKVEDDVVEKKKAKRNAKPDKDNEIVASKSIIECDLVLGMQLKVNLSALLTLQPNSMNNESTKWVAGRVICLMKGSAGKTKVKLRFRNGGEIETFWPGNDNLQVPEATTTHQNSLTSSAAASSFIAGGNVNKGNSAMDSIFAQLVQSDSSDDDSVHMNLLSSHNRGENDALRILLEGFDDVDSGDNLLHAASSDNPITKAHIASTSTSIATHTRIVNDAQLLNIATTTSNSANSALQIHAQTNMNSLAHSLTSGLPTQAHREVAMLATGEKVDAFALEEMEQKYTHYRPSFRITPDQGAAGEALQAARRRDRNFTSRQWTSQSSTHNNHYSDTNQEQEEAMAELMQGVTLAAVEDPSVPLPEPDAVFIGKVAKKLRRGEDLWRTQMYDVTIRDLRKVNNYSVNSIADTDVDAAADEGSSVDANAGNDLILPRCTVSLDAAAFTGAFSPEGVGASLYGNGDGVSGGASVQVQDPVAKENLQLLLDLCVA